MCSTAHRVELSGALSHAGARGAWRPKLSDHKIEKNRRESRPTIRTLSLSLSLSPLSFTSQRYFLCCFPVVVVVVVVLVHQEARFKRDEACGVKSSWGFCGPVWRVLFRLSFFLPGFVSFSLL